MEVRSHNSFPIQLVSIVKSGIAISFARNMFHLICWNVFCRCSILAIILAGAIGCVDLSGNDEITVVCGVSLKRSDIEVSPEVQTSKKNILSEEEFKRWTQKEQMAILFDRIINPLLRQYAEKRNIHASQDEICDATNYFNRVSRKEKDSLKTTRLSIENDLRAGTLSEEQREKLQSRKQVLDKALQIIESIEVAESSREIDFAKYFVGRQKAHDALYRQFGGDVIVIQPEGFKEGIEPRYYPLDAYLQLLRLAERDGSLIHKDRGFMQNWLQHVFLKNQYQILPPEQVDGIFLKWRR